MNRSRRNVLGWLIAGTFAMGCVFVSVRSSPFVNELPFVPDGLGRWLDRHGELRHTIGYAVLTALLGWAWSPDGDQRYWVEGKRYRSGRRWPTLAVGLAAMAVMLEFTQMALPRRTAEWQDVAFSWAGIGAGLALCAIAAQVRRKGKEVRASAAGSRRKGEGNDARDRRQ